MRPGSGTKPCFRLATDRRCQLRAGHVRSICLPCRKRLQVVPRHRAEIFMVSLVLHEAGRQIGQALVQEGCEDPRLRRAPFDLAHDNPMGTRHLGAQQSEDATPDLGRLRRGERLLRRHVDELCRPFGHPLLARPRAVIWPPRSSAWHWPLRCDVRLCSASSRSAAGTPHDGHARAWRERLCHSARTRSLAVRGGRRPSRVSAHRAARFPMRRCRSLTFAFFASRSFLAGEVRPTLTWRRQAPSPRGVVMHPLPREQCAVNAVAGRPVRASNTPARTSAHSAYSGGRTRRTNP